MTNNYTEFLRVIWQKRQLIAGMAKRDVRSQYVGSFLGLFWSIIHPVVMISVFWFVFSIGFKAKPMSDVPFVVWLTAGLAPWYLFSDIVNGSTNIVVAHAHLIKKNIFYPQILPFVKICSALVVHFVFLGVLCLLILFQDVTVTFWIIQAVYYLFCLIVLSLGLSWMLSALNVVGVMCVELFCLRDGRLLINELAPRPHNSAHLTIDAHVCSQFEQHVRAVCGLPLGSARQLQPAAMANVLGELWREGAPPRWAEAKSFTRRGASNT